MNKDGVNVDGGLGGIISTRANGLVEVEQSDGTVILSMGPSHPATHGTVQIVTKLQGEKIIDLDVELGYLHRGFEKMCECSSYNGIMPYTDRLNYVSPIINNIGWCLVVEKLLGVEVPKRCQYVRVLMSEISRITDHLTCLAASSMELGAFTVMLYLMQARELLYELIEEVTGARLTVSYGRIGGLKEDLPAGYGEKLEMAFRRVLKLLADSNKLLLKNRIFIDRMRDVAIISSEEAIDFGLTGPLLRASGVNYDVRKQFPYSSYQDFEFEVPLGERGDNYDRFVVRGREIEQSVKICRQVIGNMPDGPIALSDPRIVLERKDRVYNSIEGMINHFEFVLKGVQPPVGETYMMVEGGNGELGFFLVSDGGGKPYRVHLRAPSFIHMGAFQKMLIGHTVADVVATFGMINMIGGECDR